DGSRRCISRGWLGARANAAPIGRAHPSGGPMKAAFMPVLKPVYRGVAILVAHCALVLSVAGQYAWDRGHLPRAWANATPVDPESPIRGRYITMHLRVEPAGAVGPYERVRLAAENGRLVAHADLKGALRLWGHAPDRLTLSEP